MDLKNFKALWDKEGKTPEGAVKCLLIAVLETIKEKNPEGKKMWGMVLPKDDLDANGEVGTAQKSAMQNFGRIVKGTDFPGAIAASYLGGSPDNNYKYSYDNKIVVDTKQTKRAEKECKLFIKSGGKDMSSPVQVKKNAEGYWKIFEYSSLYTGVKPIKGDF
nr:hypothetical protein [Candidatus Sigynarchaeota archaeon]